MYTKRETNGRKSGDSFSFSLLMYSLREGRLHNGPQIYSGPSLLLYVVKGYSTGRWYRWAQCNHKGPYKTEVGTSEAERDKGDVKTECRGWSEAL